VVQDSGAAGVARTAAEPAIDEPRIGEAGRPIAGLADRPLIVDARAAPGGELRAGAAGPAGNCPRIV
jgi:hypothetical protein